MFEWMAWTTPVAVFFTCIVLMLAGMTVWELKSPTMRGLCELGIRSGQREDDRVVRARSGAVDLVQLYRLDGGARADHAQRLMNKG
jgi:predicted small integral membrane protein